MLRFCWPPRAGWRDGAVVRAAAMRFRARLWPSCGIEASLEPGRGEVGDLDVAIHIDPADLNLAPNAGKWSGAVRLEAMQMGAAGERLGGILQAAELNLEPATYRRVMQQGLPFEVKLQRDPAAVSVRIGVVDERGGQSGSLSVRLPPPR